VTAELLVNTEFHMAVRTGLMRARPLCVTGVVFLPLMHSLLCQHDADARFVSDSLVTC